MLCYYVVHHTLKHKGRKMVRYPITITHTDSVQELRKTVAATVDIEPALVTLILNRMPVCVTELSIIKN